MIERKARFLKSWAEAGGGPLDVDVPKTLGGVASWCDECLKVSKVSRGVLYKEYNATLRIEIEGAVATLRHIQRKHPARSSRATIESERNALRLERDQLVDQVADLERDLDVALAQVRRLAAEKNALERDNAELLRQLEQLQGVSRLRHATDSSSGR